MAKGYPTKVDRRKQNLASRNKRLLREMKSISGMTWYLHEKQNRAVYNSDNKKRTTFDFWASLMNPEIVEEDDILNAFYCFITDATAGDADFYEFCHDFGYDPDENPEAKRAWKGCKAAMKKAERILTDDIYDLANELSDKCG